MNGKKIVKLGVPEGKLVGVAKLATERAELNDYSSEKICEIITGILKNPADFTTEPCFGLFAQDYQEFLNADKPSPIIEKPYQIWGEEFIDPNAKKQMAQAMTIPCAISGALMPDSHLGYSLPIGGVVATENAVVPLFVGVDIACRMRLSILDTPVNELKQDKFFDRFRLSLEEGTRFGVGSHWEGREQPDHPVLYDSRWNEIEILRHVKAKAATQIGTSGSGNHFVEFGTFKIWDENNDLDLPIGEYVALLSHSGSRGAGSIVCDRYTRAARLSLNSRDREHFGQLAWLTLDSDMGREYWTAMNLMGDYAAANHEVIHRNVSRLLGADVLKRIENHHNFAWKEVHNGKEVIVHRKGATPAGAGVLGIIPGSMASPAYVVCGKGNAASLNSASHGAGRLLSRQKAREQYNFNAIRKDLEKKGVKILSAGADEVPYVYKDIDSVMKAQDDLVEIIARFDPKIVKMSDDGQNED